MDIAVSWLRALAPTIDGTPAEIADRLSLQAVPVDRIVTIGEGLEDVVVGMVLKVGKHPNADRLTLCSVDAGGEPLEVVCGAPNVVEGAMYPFIPPGGTLPGGFRIEQRKIRGVVSHGMLCSEQELGVGTDGAGILRLRDGLVPGAPITSALDVPDARLELDLTPNRVDLACHAGVARELAPGGTADIVLPAFGSAWEPDWVEDERMAEAGGLTVRIEDAGRCFRYLAAVVRGVRVAPSPDWLQARLRAAGARPINNIVDATNYVLLELNQPLHAFDLAHIEGPEIRIRAAGGGEALTTLDGAEQSLDPVMTVIADAVRPVALAGVMGGRDSEVGDATTDVLVECAWFDPAHTRRTAAASGLSTDASYRFERGIDGPGMTLAIRRCVELILEVAGGEADPSAIRVGRIEKPDTIVPLRTSSVRRLLGLRLSHDQVAGLLGPLGFRIENEDLDGADPELRVAIPSWRGDVSREADLLEEVARRYGYDRFPDEPRAVRHTTIPDDPIWARREKIARSLESAGFFELRGLPLVSEALTREDRVELLRPLAATESALRTDLVPPMVERLRHNFARGHRDIRLFEIGTVFRLTDEAGTEDVRERFHEEMRVGLLMTGHRYPEHWSAEAEDLDVFDLLGVIERVGILMAGLELRPGLPTSDPPAFGATNWLGSDRFAMFLDDEFVGAAGLVRDEIVGGPPWAGAVFGAEFRLAALAVGDDRRYSELPTYPSTSRDLALRVPVSIAAAEVGRVIRAAGPPELVTARPFDVYQGGNGGDVSRSIAWRLVFRAPDRTLTDAEVEPAVEKILKELGEKLDVRVRES